MNSKILIIAGPRIFGPFPDQETAEAWIDAPHDVGTAYELYSIRDCAMGTAERADECGTRLTTIAEATSTTTTRRKATGA